MPRRSRRYSHRATDCAGSPGRRRKPEGKLATPAISVRIDARAPACDRLSPNDAVISGKITLTTALNRCSVICAVQLAASRPQLASGKLTASIFSAFDKCSSSEVSPISYADFAFVASSVPQLKRGQRRRSRINRSLCAFFATSGRGRFLGRIWQWRRYSAKASITARLAAPSLCRSTDRNAKFRFRDFLDADMASVRLDRDRKFPRHG